MINPANITISLSVLTVVAQLAAASGLGILLSNQSKKITDKLSFNYFLGFTYLIALTATLGSLYYSEIAGYNPCKLCWYQRILMYPQTIIYIVAMVRNDIKVFWYGLVLSALGAAAALYHYLLQLDIIHSTSCTTIGFSISCSDRFSTTFGYITIPMMAFSAFSLILVSWLIFWRGHARST